MNSDNGPMRVGMMLAVVLLAGVGMALGQGAGREGLTRRQMQAPSEAPVVDWADARRAFQLAENACIAGQVELAQAPTDRDYLWVSDVVGVRVTLRAGGTVMGVGEAFLPVGRLDFSDPALNRATPVVDLYALTRSATDQALKAVQLTLGDLGRSAPAGTQPGNVAGKPATLAEIGRKLNVDLQVARWPRTITLAADAPAEAIYVQWATGYHGLVSWRKDVAAGSKAEARYAWVWPATALAENLAPRDQLVQLLARLDYPLTAVPRFGRSDRAGVREPAPKPGPGKDEALPGVVPGVGFAGIPGARFRVIHVVRPGPGLPPTQLDRGNVVLPASSISGDDLAKLAEDLAQHLTQQQRADGWWRGTFWPTADKHDPERAAAEEVALAAWALVRRANFLSETQPGNAQLEACRSAVRKAVDALLPVPTARAGKVELSPGAAAFTVLLLVDAPGQAERPTERDRLLKELLTLQQPDHTFRAAWNPPDKDKAAPANLPTQALLALALTAGYEQTRDPALGQAAEQALQAIWMGRQPNQLVGAMPWLALAEYRWQAARLAAGDVTEDQRKAMLLRGPAIVAMAQALRGKIVDTAPDFGPADVVGGMDFTRPGPDAPANPDWRTAQFLVLLSRTLREPAVSEGKDRYPWLLDCGLGFRFIQQLSFTQAGCYYVRSPEECLGGVRLSLWDNRVAVMPSAMALLAATELQTTLLQLQAQR